MNQNARRSTYYFGAGEALKSPISACKTGFTARIHVKMVGTRRCIIEFCRKGGRYSAVYFHWAPDQVLGKSSNLYKQHKS